MVPPFGMSVNNLSSLKGTTIKIVNYGCVTGCMAMSCIAALSRRSGCLKMTLRGRVGAVECGDVNGLAMPSLLRFINTNCKTGRESIFRNIESALGARYLREHWD